MVLEEIYHYAHPSFDGSCHIGKREIVRQPMQGSRFNFELINLVPGPLLASAYSTINKIM
jgi:hypothetical protein